MYFALSTILNNPFLVIVVVIVWFILFSWLVHKTFRVLSTSYTSKTETKEDDKVVSTASKAFIGLLIVSSLYIASLPLPVSEQMHTSLEYLFISLMSLSGAMFLASLISLIVIGINVRKYKQPGQKLHAAVPFLNTIIRIVSLSGALIVIMRLYKVDVTPALASAGVVGVGVAFAAKDFIANLFGGLSIFFDRPYTVGDYIIIDQIHRGEVQEIGMRSTKIRTRDGVLLTAPNSVMVTSTIVNETGFDSFLRVRLPLQVEYASDLECIENLLLEVASAHPEILDDPVPLVRYRGFSDVGVNLEFMFVIAEPANKGRITHELIKMIHHAFEREHIVLPYPHRQILMDRRDLV